MGGAGRGEGMGLWWDEEGGACNFCRGNRSPLCGGPANVSAQTRDEDDGGDVGRKLMCWRFATGAAVVAVCADNHQHHHHHHHGIPEYCGRKCL